MNTLDSTAAATSATPARTRRLLLLATRASVLTALVLIAGKAVAWLLTGSVSVLASLVDSMLDAAASIINLLAVHYALTPPDDEHRFGHGKAEALAGLGQATFIAGSSVFLVLQAVERLLHPQPLQDVTIAVAVMLFAIAATAILVQIQRYVIRHTNSTAIRADSLHYLTDLLTNLSTLLALGLAVFGWTSADPLFALGIAVYILYSAWQIGYEAVELLMDRELPTPDQERVYAIARSQPLVQGVHDVRTRRSGQTYFIQLHLEMDPTLSLVQAHAVADEVYLSLRSAFPNADVLIHEDPSGVEDIEHRQTWTAPPADGKP